MSNGGQHETKIHHIVQPAQSYGDIDRYMNVFVHYGALRNLAISKGAAPAGPLLGILFLGLSYILFWYFIYRRGNYVAKWVFVIVTVGSVAMIPLNLREIIAIGTTYAIADGVSFLFQLGAATMLFRGDATLWLGRRKDKLADTTKKLPM